jgi:RNA polymerase sigma-B factor
VTQAKAEADALFREFRESGDVSVRNLLVERHLHLAEHLVRRYVGRSAPEDDLRQVARMGLVHAVDRFDPSKGFEFATFANRTMDGEIKRYFRDRTWSVRPPRRSQELYLMVRTAEEELTQALGRSPRVPELAHHLGVDEEDVLEGLEAVSAYRSTSLDPAGGEDEGDTLVHRSLGAADPEFSRAELGVWLETAMAGLEPRERQILEMRFARGMSQPEIAAEIGISQSYLSRLLRRILRDLRLQMTAGAEDT